MSQDFIVTTPKSEIANAKLEAEEAKRHPGTRYFRRFGRMPRGLVKGSRIFYVEDSYIRGFAVVDEVQTGAKLCTTTNREWRDGVYAMMPVETWMWIRPFPMQGFRNWQYFEPPADLQIVGGWLDPMPEVQPS